MKLKIMAATKCAWRARYLYINDRKVAYIGIDPNEGVNPQMFGGIIGKTFRFRLPSLSWKYPCSSIRTAAYKAVRTFWHNMDGRYGWGSKPKHRGW